MDKDEVIKHHEELHKDIFPGADGFYVFWPSEARGCFSSHNLRAIADRLDELNAPWEKEIDEYFNSKGSG